MPTPFQVAVWQAISTVPKGFVTTYGAIANHLNTKAVRAVGTAVGKNPNAPKVPCHRVVLSNGKIGSYSGNGGKEAKIKLLRDESITVENGKIKDFKKRLYDFSGHYTIG